MELDQSELSVHSERNIVPRESGQRAVPVALTSEGFRGMDATALGRMIHSFRNTLAGIAGAAGVIARDDNSSPRSQRMVEIINRQIMSLDGTLENLHSLSRAGRGQLKLVLRPVDIAELLRQLLRTTELQSELSQRVFEVVVPEEPVIVEGDAGRLKQTFEELLRNAVAFTSRGDSIWCRLIVEPRRVIFCVEDNGEGIPPEDVPRVFDPFYQAPRRGGRLHIGMGIGLSLAESFVRAHSGNMMAFSRGHGMGSRFEVRLPLAQAHFAERNAAPVPRVSLRGLRLLVLGDDQESQVRFREQLGPFGVECRTVVDGMEALREVRSFLPDVVFCTTSLQGLQTSTFVRLLRMDPLFESCRVFACVSDSEVPDVALYQSCKVDRLLRRSELSRMLMPLLEEVVTASAHP